MSDNWFLCDWSLVVVVLIVILIVIVIILIIIGVIILIIIVIVVVVSIILILIVVLVLGIIIIGGLYILTLGCFHWGSIDNPLQKVRNIINHRGCLNRRRLNWRSLHWSWNISRSHSWRLG